MKLVIGTAQFGMKYGLKKKKIKDNEFKKIKSFLIKSNINKHIFKKWKIRFDTINFHWFKFFFDDL